MRERSRGPEPATSWVDLREVVVEHHREIFRYARLFTHADADAEDLAQTAVVRALQRGTIVATDDAQAFAYVKRIVRNLATDAARARGRVRVEPRSQVPERGFSDDVERVEGPGAGRADTGPAAQVAFARLDPRDQEVLRLRYVDELEYRRVAEQIRSTPQGARQRVYRAMRQLRAALADHGPATGTDAAPGHDPDANPA